MTIRQAIKTDAHTLAKLAQQLWPDNTLPELQAGFETLLCSGEAACFIQFAEDLPVGFAQCQLRHDYVEGTDTSPVGYLEGIYVQSEYRHRRFAKALLRECEKWAKEKRCTEFASDCELDNDSSLKFHMSMGFEEANRIICFRKDI